jgi:hypothetical protein
MSGATPFLGETYTGTWPSWLGESKNRDNKMCSWVLWDSELSLRWRYPAKNWKLQTRLLVREGAQQRQDSKIQTELTSGRKLQGALDAKTYVWLTVSRNVTSASTRTNLMTGGITKFTELLFYWFCSDSLRGPLQSRAYSTAPCWQMTRSRARPLRKS